jgi:hypothetical protein
MFGPLIGTITAVQVINKLDADYDEEFLDREIMTMKKVCVGGGGGGRGRW